MLSGFLELDLGLGESEGVNEWWRESNSVNLLMRRSISV